MELRVVKPPGQDLVVERLKSRYGLGGGCPTEVRPRPACQQPGWRRSDGAERPERRRRPPRTPDDVDVFSCGDELGSSLSCDWDERRRGPAPLCSSFKLRTGNCLDDDLDSFRDVKQQEREEEFIGDDHRVSTSRVKTQSHKEIGKAVAWPPDLASNSRNWPGCRSDGSDSPGKRVGAPGERAGASDRQGVLPLQVNQIYEELFQIHQKLQCETAAQQEFAEELHKRERFLVEREQLLFRHEAALSKIKGVKEEVLTRFQIIKEQHDAEVEHLTEVLKERNKESKRLRSSFDALKELNDSLKKQLHEVSEENRKLEVQAKRVQARLDNLQRKYEFMTIQRLKGNPHAAQEVKSLKQEKAPVSKPCKVPLNGQVYELLTVFMDWISDHHLSKLKHEDSGMDAFTCDDRAAAVDALCGGQASRAFCQVHILVSEATRRWSTADHLAQAFDSLCLDLKTDEGKILFLEYQAVPVILSHLKISSKGLLSNVIDSLLQMTVESRSSHVSPSQGGKDQPSFHCHPCSLPVPTQEVGRALRLLTWCLLHSSVRVLWSVGFFSGSGTGVTGSSAPGLAQGPCSPSWRPAVPHSSSEPAPCCSGPQSSSSTF
ncbi:coiled-coil domain-containing protein 138 isoform X7 [Phacochoerus africanus]|uniref:coiled-coil domain-containing protein 138 isoform X7 n=1 Tax=Phacochoerus africanus TaxID=41426 RepID=UPI001FD9737A|nr:coiled-coil domain-containing protein 138 isoform X7 [Phacochoerus africanus]